MGLLGSDIEPSDVGAYLLTPTSGAVALSSSGNAALVIAADPTRIVLILSCAGPSANMYISPVVGGLTARGIAMSPNSGPLVLTAAQHGLLCQCAWYGQGNGGASSCNFTAMSYSKMPDPDANPIARLAAQRLQTGPAPSLRGRLADYWRKITGR